MIDRDDPMHAAAEGAGIRTIPGTVALTPTGNAHAITLRAAVGPIHPQAPLFVPAPMLADAQALVQGAGVAVLVDNHHIFGAPTLILDAQDTVDAVNHRQWIYRFRVRVRYLSRVGSFFYRREVDVSPAQVVPWSSILRQGLERNAVAIPTWGHRPIPIAVIRWHESTLHGERVVWVARRADLSGSGAPVTVFALPASSLTFSHGAVVESAFPSATPLSTVAVSSPAIGATSFDDRLRAVRLWASRGANLCTDLFTLLDHIPPIY